MRQVQICQPKRKRAPSTKLRIGTPDRTACCSRTIAASRSRRFNSSERPWRRKNAEIHIIKNTLFRRAAGEDAEKLPYEFHNGPTAVAFVHGSESDAAKAVVDFAHTHQNFKVKGGFFGGRPLSAAEVVSLSKLPPRDVLIAQVIGAIASPLTSLVGVIEALYADPIRVIGAVADKVAESSPIPEAEPVAAPTAEDVPAEAPGAEAAPAQDVPAEAPAAEATPSEDVPAEAPAAEAPTAEAP